ncbi:MAG: c-type cytochrome [Gammaproteobacteria bacterium]|nr:c-type cytochrome [Gammaproteobacteria bacterium]
MKYYLFITLTFFSSLAFSEAFHDLYEVDPGEMIKGNGEHKLPQWKNVKKGEVSDSVKHGYSIFMNGGQLKPTGVVNNGMSCTNCHLSAGRLAHAAPMWAAEPAYPAYRKKNKKINTFEDRIQGCFLYSMNAKDGKPPLLDSKEILDLTAYSQWLTGNIPKNKSIPGRGFVKLEKPEHSPEYQRGEIVYNKQCALCHNVDGSGRQVAERYVFPPLWGKDSFNWGAGMHRVNTAASFIKANMPLGMGNSLTDQEAWDVAFFINSHERPQDPRFKNDLDKTKKEFHQHDCQYDQLSPVDNHKLGSTAY